MQPILRRLVYMGIKDMSKIANDVIIVTSRSVVCMHFEVEDKCRLHAL